jgi:hypothetical protein
MRFIGFLSVLLLFTAKSFSQEKDTISIGVYITSIYDLSLPENSFKTDFWLWFNYKNDSLKPLETIELVNAKEIEISMPSTEKKNNINWGAQKIKTQIKKQWNIDNFPFDTQILQILVEEAIKDTSALIFKADKANSKLDKNVTLEGWEIKKFQIESSISTYNTTYGDPILKGNSSYPNILISIGLERKGGGIFFKLFVGVYIAFAISTLVFFIDPTDVDPRFGLSVGSLFAAVGNKYIVDSILPETITFTLVDKVHLLTFFFIFISLMISVQSLYWAKKNQIKVSKRLDTLGFGFISITYILINMVLISQAIYQS